MWKKKSDKQKQLLEKRKKDIDTKDEEIKEQKKQIAGFTKAAEEFDQQRRLAADREKELLEHRNNAEQSIKTMLTRMESMDRSSNDVSMDRSSMLGEMQNFQAMINPDN